MRKNLRTSFITRQYMLSKDFEIYYYNDMNMGNVGNHAHDYYEFYCFIGGAVSIEIDGSAFTLSKGDIIVIPPNRKHHLDILDPKVSYERIIFWISQDYCNQLMQLSSDYGYLMQHVITTNRYIFHMDLYAFNSIQSKMFSLIEELHSDRFGKAAKVSLQVNDLVFCLNRYIYEMENPNKPRGEHTLYQNLLTYIEGHLDEELTLDSLARQFYVSKYHIAHVFKENLGLSVHQYILKKRLHLSREAMLSADIGEAYLLCGFKDYSSFFRAFKKEFGMSPREYKALHSPIDAGGS